MTRNTMATNTGQTENLIKWVSLVLSAIASWIAINAFIAIVVKQDPLLILLMTATAITIAVVLNYARNRIRFGIVPVIFALVASGILAIVAWSWLAGSGVTPVKISINDPQDGTNVTLRYLAKGTVSDADAKVYVILHPLTVSEMWVQQTPIVDAQGNWQSTVIFGTDTLGIGDRYELIALATNDNFLVSWATGNSLSNGQVVTSLPRKSNRSNLATVIRPK
ncbi:MAG: hypothetical protein HY741_04140 [Chloroflexi bacterium]|nr:hypothetical protein [Chloroflexota bacterium]